MDTHTYHLGIDPGVRNLAMALITEEGSFVDGKTFDMIPEGTSVVQAITCIYSKLQEVCKDRRISTVGMERFVAYQDTQTSSSENILLLTGALVNACHTQLNITRSPEIKLMRAIDWKPGLCKLLVKRMNFRNPSSTFDKKYSKAAAEIITKSPFKDDHLADATCIAFYTKEWVQYSKLRQLESNP